MIFNSQIDKICFTDPKRFQQLSDEDLEIYAQPEIVQLTLPKTNDSRCQKKLDNWIAWRAASFPAKRHSEYLFIPKEDYKNGPKILVSAVITLPKTMQDYIASIPGKRRRDILAKRAINHGYVYRSINPAEYTSNIWQIVHSKDERQGRAFTAPYYNRADNADFPEYDIYKDPNFQDICTGVFDVEENLVAYILGKRVGSHVQYDEILGHNNHLSQGIMQLLHFGFIEQCINLKESPTCLNYGPWYSGQNPFSKEGGLNQWKRRAGFRPAYLIAALS